MENQRLVAILCGGPSPEHDVSCSSAAQVLETLREREAFLVTVDRTGERWRITGTAPMLTHDAIAYLRSRDVIVFIAMHGPYGEDGTVQRLLDDAGITYTASDAPASALANDKVRAAERLAAHGLSIPQFVHATMTSLGERDAFTATIRTTLALPVVIKPNNVGSSIGVHLVHDDTDLDAAIDDALRVSPAILAQTYVHGRELTCGVLDDGVPSTAFALPVTEIIPSQSTFFDYAAKYDASAVMEVTPARISKRDSDAVQSAARTAHRALGCSGMSRTDFILDGDGKLWTLETNTIPGLTPTSLLPQAALAAGISFLELLERVLAAAERRNVRTISAASTSRTSGDG